MASTVLKFFLFDSIISLVNPGIILLPAVGCAVGYLASVWERKRTYETEDQLNIVNKKINYLAFHIARNLKYVKEIRLYNFRKYLALFSVVFQDYRLFHFSLAANVTASFDYDSDKSPPLSGLLSDGRRSASQAAEKVIGRQRNCVPIP